MANNFFSGLADGLVLGSELRDKRLERQEKQAEAERQKQFNEYVGGLDPNDPKYIDQLMTGYVQYGPPDKVGEFAVDMAGLRADQAVDQAQIANYNALRDLRQFDLAQGQQDAARMNTLVEGLRSMDLGDPNNNAQLLNLMAGVDPAGAMRNGLALQEQRQEQARQQQWGNVINEVLTTAQRDPEGANQLMQQALVLFGDAEQAAELTQLWADEHKADIDAMLLNKPIDQLVTTLNIFAPNGLETEQVIQLPNGNWAVDYFEEGNPESVQRYDLGTEAQARVTLANMIGGPARGQEIAQVLNERDAQLTPEVSPYPAEYLQGEILNLSEQFQYEGGLSPEEAHRAAATVILGRARDETAARKGLAFPGQAGGAAAPPEQYGLALGEAIRRAREERMNEGMATAP